MQQNTPQGNPSPLPDLRELQRFHRQLDREELALQAEEPQLRYQWASWFPARQQMHFESYNLQVQDMAMESELRRAQALPYNVLYWVTGKGQPRSTGYQEELFVRRSQTMHWQQFLRNVELDRSSLERKGIDLALKRARIDSDWTWLQWQYQRVQPTNASGTSIP